VVIQQAAHGLAVRHGRGAVLVLCQVFAEKRADLAIVVNNEDMGLAVHSALKLSKAAACRLASFDS
jgi:hypothetical protein